jgi:hypothetical protein
LATALSARSRTTVVASSPLVPRTTSVIARPFNRPELANPVPAGVSSVTIAAMFKKLNHSYYVMVTRQTAYPPSWRWRIVRRGEPMGVQIEGCGFSSYHAARLAGGRALADFLEQLELEKSRIE